jgi:hypothetical protein
MAMTVLKLKVLSPYNMNQRSRHHELEYSFFVIIILSGVYIAYEMTADPRGGHPFGHWLGIVGTLMMVMTETLYSLRKRTRLFNRAGPVRVWLSFPIFTGLVWPFLVLMHTGLAFGGLAGVTLGLTAVVVLSGFIGRYLYTRQETLRRWFRLWHTVHIPIGLTLFISMTIHILATIYFRAGVFE